MELSDTASGWGRTGKAAERRQWQLYVLKRASVGEGPPRQRQPEPPEAAWDRDETGRWVWGAVLWSIKRRRREKKGGARVSGVLSVTKALEETSGCVSERRAVCSQVGACG